MRESFKKLTIGALAITLHGEAVRAAEFPAHAKPNEVSRIFEQATTGAKAEAFETAAFTMCKIDGSTCRTYGVGGSDRIVRVPLRRWKDEAGALMKSWNISDAVPLIYHNHPREVIIKSFIQEQEITENEAAQFRLKDQMLSGPSPLDYQDPQIRFGNKRLQTVNILFEPGGGFAYIQKDPLEVSVESMETYMRDRTELLRSSAHTENVTAHIQKFVEQAKKVNYVMEFLPSGSSNEDILAVAQRITAAATKPRDAR